MKYVTLEEYRNAPKVLADAVALPEHVERAIEHQRARNITMGIYDGKATSDAMTRLADGNNVSIKDVEHEFAHKCDDVPKDKHYYERLYDAGMMSKRFLLMSKDEAIAAALAADAKDTVK